MNLFVYGTLINPTIWNHVVCGKYVREKATLHGFARRKLFKRNYPVMIKEEGSSIDGIIIYDIENDDITKLDLFEGTAYKRIPVEVLTKEQDGVPCQAYYDNHQDKRIIQEEEWNYEEFLKNDISQFIEGYPGWLEI